MNDVMNFLECCILPLSDDTYQLRFFPRQSCLVGIV